MSLGKLVIFSSLLSPCSSTLLRQQSFRTRFSAAPIYVRQQNLVSFLKSIFFLTCHKVAAGQKSCLSQQDVKLALLNGLFPDTSLEICSRANNWNNPLAKTRYHLHGYLPFRSQNTEKRWQAQLCHSKLEEPIYREFKWPVESSFSWAWIRLILGL